MRALLYDSMCMVRRRSSCLIQQLSKVRLYRLKLSNQNLNTVRLVVLPSFETEIWEPCRKERGNLREPRREQKRGVERPINPYES